MRNIQPRYAWKKRDLFVVFYMLYPLVLMNVDLLLVYFHGIKYSTLLDQYSNIMWPFNRRYEATLSALGVDGSQVFRVKIIFANSSFIILSAFCVRLFLQLIYSKTADRYYSIMISQNGFIKIITIGGLFSLGIMLLFYASDFSESKDRYAWSVHKPLIISLEQAIMLMYGIYFFGSEVLGCCLYLACKPWKLCEILRSRPQV